MNAIVDFQWSAVSAALVLLATIVVAMAFDMGRAERWAKPTAWVALIGTLVALGFAMWGTRDGVLAFGAQEGGRAIPVFVADEQTRILTVIALIGTGLSIFLSIGYLDRHRIQRGEFYILMLLSVVGMILLAGGNDLILLFLGLELLSLPLYILAGFLRDRASSEASLKYFLLGAFSSGFFLYGIALVYGATGGTTNLTEIAEVMTNAAPSNLFRAGITLILVGFGFKVAAVPFHLWAPDVYEGAPTPVTAFFASVPKVAGFAGLLRVFHASLPAYSGEWTLLFAILAALSMTVGNLIALTQSNIKRMLAYSSIAHVGYLFVGLAAGGAGVRSVLFYLLVYSLMSIGAFGVVILRGEGENERTRIEDYAGLGFRRPLAAAAMTVFLVSLAGFPPTAGFMGKFLLFRDAYDAGLGWLVIIAVLNSVVSAFYYLGVVVRMYMTEPAEEIRPHGVRGVSYSLLVIALLISMVGILIGGVTPSRIVRAMDTERAPSTMTSSAMLR